MKAMVIYNPTAGQRDNTDELGLMIDALRQQGWETGPVQTISSPGDATRYARAAADDGCSVVFCVGGDGTVAQAVEGLLETDTALAVLPGGTGNVMARQLNLPIPGGLRPHPLLDALSLTLQGHVRTVDVGRVCLAGGVSRHFLCWSGAGFDAQVSMAVAEEPERKRRLGVIAFFMAVARTLTSYAGARAVIRVDGRRLNRRLMMLVANNIQLYAAWLRIAPTALIDDGWLDIYALSGRDPLHAALDAVGHFISRSPRTPNIEFWRCRRLEIIAARPMPVHVDGDAIGYTPAVIDVVPQALHLLVPAGAPGSLFSDGNGGADASLGAWLARLAHDAQVAFGGRAGPE